MKKVFVVLILLTLFSPVGIASEITEDYFDMATSYCIEGKYNDALSYLDKILALEPNNKAVSDLRNGLKQIIDGNHGSFITSSNAIKEYINAKKIGNSQAELTALLSGNDYWTYYFLGEYYQKNNDYKQAINYYVKSINQKPALTQCYMQIASCYFKLKDFSQSLMYINQYLKANPSDDYAYYVRSKINMNIRDFDSALNDILTAISIENSIDYRFHEAKVLYFNKKYHQANEKFKVLSDDIQNAELYKYRGYCEYELGNKNEALLNFEKSILLSDDDKALVSKYNELKN